jgi:hypothetical protein
MENGYSTNEQLSGKIINGKKYAPICSGLFLFQVTFLPSVLQPLCLCLSLFSPALTLRCLSPCFSLVFLFSLDV